MPNIPYHLLLKQSVGGRIIKEGRSFLKLSLLVVIIKRHGITHQEYSNDLGITGALSIIPLIQPYRQKNKKNEGGKTKSCCEGLEVDRGLRMP